MALDIIHVIPGLPWALPLPTLFILAIHLMDGLGPCICPHCCVIIIASLVCHVVSHCHCIVTMSCHVVTVALSPCCVVSSSHCCCVESCCHCIVAMSCHVVITLSPCCVVVVVVVVALLS